MLLAKSLKIIEITLLPQIIWWKMKNILKKRFLILPSKFTYNNFFTNIFAVLITFPKDIVISGVKTSKDQASSITYQRLCSSNWNR